MGNIIRAIVDPRKFSEYIFKENADHGKNGVLRKTAFQAV